MNTNSFVNRSQLVYKKISPYIKRTPLVKSEHYSKKYNRNIFFKLENQQHTNAFKARGAVSKLVHAIHDLKGKKDINGVVAASGGNHGLGLCYAASLFDGIQPHIFLFESVSKFRQDLIKSYGGVVHVYGKDWNESNEMAKEFMKSNDSYLMVHPFDDEYIILGQSTVALEIVEQMKSFSKDEESLDLDAVICSVGGGGLISGISQYIKEYTKNKTKVFGVETYGAKSMYESFYANKIVTLPEINTICEGLGARAPSERTFKAARANVDDCFLVSDEQTMVSLHELLDNDKIFCEPSATCCLSSLDQIIEKNDNLKNIVIVLCGANFQLQK